MLIANCIEDVFLSPKIKGSFNLYICKKGGQLVLIATFYEEWHAIRARHLFRLIYGLKPSEISKRDYMYDTPLREDRLNEKVTQLNLKSHNKMVRQHEALHQQLTAVVKQDEEPAEWAVRLLKEMNDREAKDQRRV